MEAKLHRHGFAPLKQFLRAHLWLHQHTVWPTISPFAVPWTPPAKHSSSIQHSQAPHHHRHPLHPRQPADFVAGAVDFLRDIQPTAQPDPIASQDLYMCARWLDAERLPER